MSVLAERLLAVHDALERARVPHAFGGAIALAYCTLEPRGTRDVDVNVFAGLDEVDRVVEALPAEIVVGDDDVDRLRRDGQARLWWDDTPIDVFFDTHAFHVHAAATVRLVPFAESTIPVLGCVTLAVFKALFGRTKDWADLEAMVEAGALDVATVTGWIVQLLGPYDPRIAKLTALASDPPGP